MKYAELHCLSNFSFLRGSSHPEELVQQAAKLGYRAIAITDECTLAGVVKAHVAARQTGIQLIIGSEFYTREDLHVVMLAPHRPAYGQLSALISKARRRSNKGRYELAIKDMEHTVKDCLFIWFPSAEQCQQLLRSQKSSRQTGSQKTTDRSSPLTETQEQISNFIKHAKGRLWVGIENNLSGAEKNLIPLREQLARQLQIATVACGNVQMHLPKRKPLLDVLTAIRLNTTIHHTGFYLHPNRECYLRPLHNLQLCYRKEALQETINIVNRCRFSLEELRYEYPRELVPPRLTASQYLRQLVDQGAKIRWPRGTQKPVHALIQKELRLIAELNYEYYFLTVYDIVQFARNEQILCQGRGSAANSAVCFCLFITEVDPEKSNLLFERFISRERNEPPDIDVDFEHERREEVIQFIYRKYGRQRAALAATVITYRIKSAIRDVGKALGFDQTLIDQLSKSIAYWDKEKQLPPRLKELGISPNNPRIQHFKYLVDEILGFPRHLSQHVGGFIIASGQLDQLVPIENAAMAERTIVQWDKTDIETLGLLKIDVLALGMLSAIRKTFQLVEEMRGQQLTMSTLPREDPDTYRMLQAGDSIGVFQVESRAQIAMLPRLKPACFYDLVIEVAIVRPGPIQGNMVHPYLKRRQGRENVEYPDTEIKNVLQRTLGIPIFQEQVIQLAMVAAGFTAGEADHLRRAMASWRRKGELQQYQDKLTAGLLARGYSPEFANRIIEQINGFGEYGFPESHAASFALLVYVSAWLKRHEPAAFCCSLLNSQPMGFYSPSQLVQDIKRHGVEVLPVDICYSQWDHTLDTSNMAQQLAQPSKQNPRHSHRGQPAIRLGFRLIKGLSRQGAENIVSARNQSPFYSPDDLKNRAGLNRKDLDFLARANALHSLAGHRYQARWQVQGINPDSPLIHASHIQEPTVVLPAPGDGQNLMEDYNSTGLTLNKHPMALLRHHPMLKGCKTHQELKTLTHKRFVRIAGIVTGRQRPGSAAGVIFITLEDETGNSNILVWRTLVERQRAVVIRSSLLKVKGIIEREGAVVHIIAGELEDLSYLLGELETSSRDFH